MIISCTFNPANALNGFSLTTLNTFNWGISYLKTPQLLEPYLLEMPGHAGSRQLQQHYDIHIISTQNQDSFTLKNVNVCVIFTLAHLFHSNWFSQKTGDRCWRAGGADRVTTPPHYAVPSTLNCGAGAGLQAGGTTIPPLFSVAPEQAEGQSLLHWPMEAAMPVTATFYLDNQVATFKPTMEVEDIYIYHQLSMNIININPLKQPSINHISLPSSYINGV